MFYSTARDGGVFLDALRHGFRDLGYVEGSTLVLDAYWGNDSQEGLSKVMEQMLATTPDVIVAQGVAVNAVYRAKSSIPVVFGFSGDPVEAGLVQSFSHPAGRLTGISFLTLELVGKRIEMLREVMPGLKRVAILAAPQHPGDTAERRASEIAAASLGISTAYFEARSAPELQPAMTAMEKSGCDAVVMFPVQYVIAQREQIAAWAVRNRLPTVSGWAQFAEGAAISCRTAEPAGLCFAARVLRRPDCEGNEACSHPGGASDTRRVRPQPEAAKALGINVPRAVELRADRVIT